MEALSPDPLCLCRFTRHVRVVHRVPGLGTDPFGWLDAALAVAARRGAEVLLPVQEQVTVMSLARERIASAGLATAVPDFAALARVQDKVTAFRTLGELGLPQPDGFVAMSQAELGEAGPLPVFVKTPIGTASAGVIRVESRAELRELGDRLSREGLLGDDGVLVQQPVPGPLVMVQSVFARGELVAFHACERVSEGTGGGASRKRSVRLPEVQGHLSTLGTALGWHGALSADVILGPGGPVLIDINPRLVEPANAARSGVDLAGTLLDVARTGSASSLPVGAADVRTHQLLLAILGAAQHSGHRRAVLREIGQAVTRTGPYRDSTEELTPARSDWRTVLPVAFAAAATLAAPRAWRWFASGAPSAYALSPAGWRALLADHQRPGGRPGEISTISDDR